MAITGNYSIATNALTGRCVMAVLGDSSVRLGFAKQFMRCFPAAKITGFTVCDNVGGDARYPENYIGKSTHLNYVSGADTSATYAAKTLKLTGAASGALGGTVNYTPCDSLLPYEAVFNGATSGADSFAYSNVLLCVTPPNDAGYTRAVHAGVDWITAAKARGANLTSYWITRRNPSGAVLAGYPVWTGWSGGTAQLAAGANFGTYAATADYQRVSVTLPNAAIQTSVHSPGVFGTMMSAIRFPANTASENGKNLVVAAAGWTTGEADGFEFVMLGKSGADTTYLLNPANVAPTAWEVLEKIGVTDVAIRLDLNGPDTYSQAQHYADLMAIVAAIRVYIPACRFHFWSSWDSNGFDNQPNPWMADFDAADEQAAIASGGFFVSLRDLLPPATVGFTPTVSDNWTSGVQYYTGDTVLVGATGYVCTANVKGATSPGSDAGHWATATITHDMNKPTRTRNVMTNDGVHQQSSSGIWLEAQALASAYLIAADVQSEQAIAAAAGAADGAAAQLAADQATVAGQLAAQVAQLVSVTVLDQAATGTAVTEATAQSRETAARIASQGTGPNAVTVTVTNSETGATIGSAAVALGTLRATTNASGAAVFYCETNTFTLSISKGGWQHEAQSVVVSGAMAVAATMTPRATPPGHDPHSSNPA
jgi:hypothetical protein